MRLSSLEWINTSIVGVGSLSQKMVPITKGHLWSHKLSLALLPVRTLQQVLSWKERAALSVSESVCTLTFNSQPIEL
jgi:hypothetical protein